MSAQKGKIHFSVKWRLRTHKVISFDIFCSKLSFYHEHKRAYIAGMPFTVISSKVFVALIINFMKRIHYHTETEAEIWPWNYCELFYRFSTLKIVEEQSNYFFLVLLVSLQVQSML